ncbi:zinc-binding alcohol dehydrogenase family protein [Rhodophyticola sp. CCM32]|uniref:zinc-binding alcohol dehydrogenase family protein n=1 Tax=Rhodophyticola sp. CCM32 TaxID=2916397 RepID=UPI00107F2905|nr:zinc-binding alcohol dehydrogenase family protein [Rhodophyticola sp. CCM32]QBY00190.1 zinc-binding alcohol dehydrogenase family protein [Rhodophyticola sp. CCM32]
MKALLCLKPQTLDLVDRDLAPVPKGWVPLDVTRVGICGTDYHIFAGTQPFLDYPRVMGHEISAHVSENYEGRDVAPGAHVIVNPYLSCGDCHACKMRKPNCCENIQVLGVHRDGAMCEQIAVPPENLISAGDLTPDQAAMVEFLAIGRHAVMRSRLTAGAPVLVIGGGPIGLACALFARIDGGDVTIADVSAEKRRLMEQSFGFRTCDARDEDQMTARELAMTFVYDATGNLGAMNDALRFVAHGGTYTLVSVVKGDLSFADPEFHKRETTLLSSRNALKGDFEFVIKAISDGLIDTGLLNTHRTDFTKAAQDIACWSVARDTVIKAIIEVA